MGTEHGTKIRLHPPPTKAMITVVVKLGNVYVADYQSDGLPWKSRHFSTAQEALDFAHSISPTVEVRIIP